MFEVGEIFFSWPTISHLGVYAADKDWMILMYMVR